jgi:hypothetical protein
MKKAVLGALLVSSMLAGRVARAQDLAQQISGASFGTPGQVAISDDFSLLFRHENDTSTLTLAPAVDYFLAPHLSVGGQVTFGYATHKGGGHDTTFGLGPRVGYDISLTPMFSIFPRLSLAYTHHSETGEDSTNLLGIFLFAPFLFHPVPHFFIGFGPSLGGNFAGGESFNRFVTFELKSTVGGYFDW